MNKANLFLLVVVSSLLTYISTATQPAATAGVAQEKWEYGVSLYLGEGDPSGYEDQTASSDHWKFWPSNLVSYPIIKVENIGMRVRKTYSNQESESAVYKSVKEVDWQFKLAIKRAYQELGNEGWHPYQVEINTNEYFPERQRTYWRRRVH